MCGVDRRAERTFPRMRIAFAVSALLTLSLAAAPAAAQSSQSAALAEDLSKKMTASKLTYLAAPDSSAPDRFVGVFHIPQIELRLVAGQYTAPTLMNESILKQAWQDAYVELSSASVPNTRIIIDDLQANGLKANPGKGGAPDAFVNGSKRVDFNGEWNAQKITETQYREAFAKAEAEYVRALQLLLAQIK
jgi:hypothetical protein